MEELVSIFCELKSADALKLSATLCEHQNQVIDSFGGLTNMIELCLNAPNASQLVDTNSERFNLFKTMLNTIKQDHDESKEALKSQQKKPNMSVSIAQSTNYSHNQNVNTNTLISNTGTNNKNMQTVNTPAQYNNFKVIIDCDPRNNLIFKYIKNSNAALSIYNATQSKVLLRIMGFLLFISLPLSFASWYGSWKEVQKMSAIYHVIVSLAVVVYCIGAMSISNMSVVSLILNTFDFWFKVCNAGVLVGAMWIRGYATDHSQYRNAVSNDEYSMASIIISQMALISAFSIIFLLDATPYSVKLKKSIIIGAVFGTAFKAVSNYLWTPEYQWNPFGYKHSEISFKSTILSSWTNLTIFVAKPIWNDFMQYLTKLMRNKGASSAAGDKASIGSYQRCTTVYKRPYLKWYKIQASSFGDDNATQMATITGQST